MATSSITHNFVIQGPDVEAFANAVEESFNEETPKLPVHGRLITAPEELEELLTKVRERYAKNSKP